MATFDSEATVPPAIPPADGAALERLIAETLGIGQPRAELAPAPVPRAVAPGPAPARQQAPPPRIPTPPHHDHAAVAAVIAHDEEPVPAGQPVEPLKLGRGRRVGRLAAALLLPALALGGGWWIASDRGGLSSFWRPASTAPSTPPLIVAVPTSGRPAPPEPSPQTAQPAPTVAATPPPAAPAPVAPIVGAPQAAAPAGPQTAAPAPAAPAPTPAAPAIVAAPQPSAPPPVIPPAPAPPAPRAEPPAPADSAGVLGTIQSSPFDQVASARSVRTTAVIPPLAAPAPTIDFDDPATWPPGAERAEPHPLPPARPE